MKTSTSNQSGSTLMVVITIMSILMVVVAIAFEYTSNETRNVQRSNTLQTAMAVGDGAVEVLFNNWRNTCRTSPATVYKTSDFAVGGTYVVPTPSPFPNMRASNFVKRGTGFNPASDSDYDANYVISNYKVIALSAEYTALASAAATPEPALGQLGGNTSSVSSTTSATWNYMASADVTLPVSFGSANNRNVVAKVRRVFSKQQLSPWNWAIFYVDPLEIHPGPSFTVTGWVHTNSDLYTGHSSLTFADKVTYGSDWFVGFMPGDGSHTSDTPASPNYPNKLPPARDQALQPFGLDSSSIFSSTDTNPNNDSYHELIEPPAAGYTDALATSRYWNQAGVAIKVDASNNVTVGTPNADGTITSLGPPASGPDPRSGAQKTLYNMFSGAITTNQSIQDNREGASVRLVTLDVGAMMNGDSSGNAVRYKASSFNGIVYIYDSSNTTSARRGVRIKNGSKIPLNPSAGASGLTVASANPLYLQGDFNTGGTGASVPSNVSGSYTDPTNPPDPQISSYTRAPTSMLADAVTILSNNWSDANSTASLPGAGSPSTTPREATNTTINTAIISGIVTTNINGDSRYSGGAENFPRFLEEWSTSTLTYYGSMVELYQSKYSIGEWGNGNVYNPPQRQWFFDNNFKITPPPGSLMLVSYNKGQWALQ